MNNFDYYSLRARVVPGLLPMVCFVIFYFFTGQHIASDLSLETWTGKAFMGFLSFGVIYLASLSSRNAGKYIIENRIYEGELRMPTTDFLMPDNESLPPSFKTNLLKKISNKFKIDLNKIYEKNSTDELALRKEIVEVVSLLKEETRKDSLLLQNNTQYGFWRNFTGACLLSILIDTLFIVADLVFLQGKNILVYIGIIVATILMGIISYKVIDNNGQEYAKKLFRTFYALEEITN